MGGRNSRSTRIERPDHRAKLVPLRKYALSMETSNVNLLFSPHASIFFICDQARCLSNCQTCDFYRASSPAPFGEALFPSFILPTIGRSMFQHARDSLLIGCSDASFLHKLVLRADIADVTLSFSSCYVHYGCRQRRASHHPLFANFSPSLNLSTFNPTIASPRSVLTSASIFASRKWVTACTIAFALTAALPLL